MSITRRHALAVRMMVGVACASLPCSFARASEDKGPAAPATKAAAEDATRGGQQPAAGEGDQATGANKSVVSREAMESERPQTAFEALKNVPGVINSDTKGGVSDDFYIRGIHLSENTSYRLNGGFPIENNIALMEDKDHIEALKGVGALVFGVAPPAGIINLVTKRATERPTATLSLGATQFGQVMGALDLGGKFGDTEQFGLRTNFSETHLNKGIAGATGERLFGSVAADWQASKRLLFSLDFEGYTMNVVEQAVVRQLKPVEGAITLPDIPDPSKLLSGEWARYRTGGANVLGAARYEIADGWNVLVEGGLSHADRLERYITRLTDYDVHTGQGSESITLAGHQKYDNSYAKAELKQRSTFSSSLTNYLTIGVNRNERYFNNPSTTTAKKASQNLYNPVALPAPGPAADPTYSPQDSSDLGLYAYDTVSVLERLHLLGGMRYTIYDADNVEPTGDHAGEHTTRTTRVWSPAIGALLVLLPGVGAYGSYMKGLEETGQAPEGSANQFQVLPPASATQTEIGVRAENVHGISATLGYFNINRANAVIDPITNYYAINGTIRYQGVESTVSADIMSRLLIQAGGQWMHAVQHAPSKIDGLQPENTPAFTGNVTLTYRFGDWMKGLRLSAGALYTGRRALNPENQGFIPAVTTFSCGAGYAASVAGRRVAVNFNVSNLTDERYWSSATNNNLGVGLPRNAKLNVKIDL